MYDEVFILGLKPPNCPRINGVSRIGSVEIRITAS